MKKEERQKNLYDFLINQGNNYTTQYNIAKAIRFDGIFDYYEPCQDYHSCSRRLCLTSDIREINQNPDFEKIIISNGNGVKIATEEDYDKYIHNQYKALFAKLKRIRVIENKAKKNGQITLDKKEIIAFLENENE